MTNQQRWTLLAAVLGSSIVFLDGTIVNVALPRLGQELPANVVSQLEGQTYVVSGYLAVLAALLVLAGALADYHGRRLIFGIGLVGFGVSSLLCGLAPSLDLLVLFRVLQGATGALLVPGSLSIITATFDGEARGRAFGIWAAATSATTALGPVAGGILVDAVSWRSAFLINIPLVALGLWATVRHMPESRDEEASGKFDWLGAAVAVVAVGGLAFGAIRGQDRAWQDPLAFVALGLGAMALVAFPILMVRRRDPLVPLSLFRSRGFRVINLSTLLIYGALYVVLSFQAIFLQGTLGYTPLASGLVGLPVSILLTVLSTRVGTLAARVGARPFLAVGPFLMGAAMLWLARIPSTSDPWRAAVDVASLVPPPAAIVDVLLPMTVFGVGISLVVAPLTATLMGSIPVRNAGLGSAINNAVSRVGSPIVSAIIFIAVSGSFYATLADRIPGLEPSSPEVREEVQPLNPPRGDVTPELATAVRDASTDAYHVSVVVAAGLLIGGGAVNMLGLRSSDGRAAREDDATAAAEGAPAA
jgi:EmrB/QacA subfamily drug resistance transporter